MFKQWNVNQLKVLMNFIYIVIFIEIVVQMLWEIGDNTFLL